MTRWLDIQHHLLPLVASGAGATDAATPTITPDAATSEAPIPSADASEGCSLRPLRQDQVWWPAALLVALSLLLRRLTHRRAPT